MKEFKVHKVILEENSETLKRFFKEISKYPVLSGEEQVELARKAKQGDKKARDLLINSNLRFVITCAKQYTNQGVPLLDLIQSGVEGLIESLKNYNPDAGYKFLSFAVWYIRRELMKAIYNTSRTIRYPITYISKLSKAKKITDKFITENGREPTQEELMNLADFTEKQYNSTILDKSYCQSINTPILEDLTLEEILPDPYSDSVIKQFNKTTLLDCLNILTPREKEIIILFYGLNGEEKSIKEISKLIGLGEERVRQLRKSAIKKLKQKCGKTLMTLL